MKLVNATLRPGKVLEVLENGKIKAMVPGLFNSEDVEKIPPIIPFFGHHANSYSQPKQYEEVWVLNLSDNPLQLHWFRKDDYIKNDSQLIKEENVEVLCNRESGMGWATIYFSDGSGWIIKNDESIIQVKPDGSILLSTPTPHRTIDINSDNISIGSPGQSAHPVAYGDNVQEALEDICGILRAIQTVTKSNPYTTMISTVIGSKIGKVEEGIGTISSPHITID